MEIKLLAIFPILVNLGYYGDVLLILESIVVFLGYQFGFTFLRRYIRKEKDKKNYMILAWSLLFISFATTLFFYIIADFFVDPTILRPSFVNFGYFAIVAGSLFFTYNAEREMKSKYFPFTLVLSIFLGALLLDFFLNFINTSFIALPSIIPIIMLVFVYVNKFTSPVRSQWKKNVFGFIIGFVLVFFGFMACSDIGLKIWIGSRLIGDISLLLGLLLVSFFFFGLPSLTEAKWMDIIFNSHLYVIYKSVCIYEYTFSGIEKYDELDSQIITGGLSGISSILSNMIQSNEKLDFVEVEDKQLLFTYGKYITLVLIVDERLEIIQSKLKDFMNYVEDLFASNLESWDSNPEVLQFKILDNTIQQKFGLR